jgi:hypothetical protein
MVRAGIAAVDFARTAGRVKVSGGPAILAVAHHDQAIGSRHLRSSPTCDPSMWARPAPVLSARPSPIASRKQR